MPEKRSDRLELRSDSDARLNVIIFSKDRACQLDLLLRSIREYMHASDEVRISVLFTASSDHYGDGYDLLQRLHPDFAFHDERATRRTFRALTLRLTSKRIPYTMFLVDDDVFKNPFSTRDNEFGAFERDPNQLCLSLRLGTHITRCYTMDIATPPPPFLSEWEWNWYGEPGDWGYPMSLDGHIFRTTDILPLLDSNRYSNPNTLESKLAARPLRQRKMSCYEQSRVLNLPVNKVQSVFDNRTGDVDPAELNAIFLAQGRIRLEPFDGYVNVSPHQELPFEFMSRG